MTKEEMKEQMVLAGEYAKAKDYAETSYKEAIDVIKDIDENGADYAAEVFMGLRAMTAADREEDEALSMEELISLYKAAQLQAQVAMLAYPKLEESRKRIAEAILAEDKNNK